jgi:predicted alpha/beta superfamily hydrolase
MATDTLIAPQPGAILTEDRLATDLRRHAIDSKLLGGSRDLIVYVPPQYDAEPERRFPVLYMQDGQNLFDPNTSYVAGKPWFLDQAAEAGIRDDRIEPVIIVGVNHAGDHRIDEYTPTKDAKRNGGKSAKYAQALIDDIKPFIDAEYRTMPDPTNTGIGGSSLGGLVSLWISLTNPDVFGRVAAMSPSIWWDRRMIVRLAEKIQPKPRLSVWLDIGTAEGGPTLADARQMRETLIERGWLEHMDLEYVEAEGAIHDEAAWGERSRPMLEFLFPNQKVL